jgi:predicted Zn-dependent protease
MPDLQDQYDDAMFDYSRGDYDCAVSKFDAILAENPAHFDAQLSLAMAHYRKGDFATAITEGHKAEKLRPNEQLVHTNLSLFYMKAGDKKTAEHYGAQARVASWKESLGQAKSSEAPNPDLEMAKPPPTAASAPPKFPDMPWKKKPPITGGPTTK